MGRSAIKPLIEVEVIQRLSAGLLFFGYGRFAGELLRVTSGPVHYYVLVICINVGLILMLRFLGTSPLVRDLQEICFYDVLVAILGWVMHWRGQPDTVFWVAAASVDVARYLRLLWWRVDMAANSEIQYAWPVFGLLGLVSPNWHRVGYDARGKTTAYLYLTVAALIPVVGEYWSLATNETVIPLLVIYAVVRIVPRGIAAVENAVRERDKLTHENAVLEVRAELGARFKERNTDLCLATHDSKGPIMALINMAESLQHNTDPEVTRATARHLVSGLHELGNLQSEIIMMAQVTTETVSPNADMIDMRTLMWQIRQVVADEAHKRKVMLVLDDPCFYVKSNKWLLTRIITNLTMNAIVHGSKASMVQISIYARNGNCYISIWDTGRGIPNANGPDRAANFTNLVNTVHQRPAHIPHQGDNVLAGGHGLGLKSVMRMCNTLGITMTLFAKPGWGSRFRFCVPLAGPDEKPPLIATQILFDMMQAQLKKPPGE